MSVRNTVRADPRAALFSALSDVRAGMLGVDGSGQHMQPMTHFPDEERGEIYFVTSSDTELVRAVGQGARAHYCVIGEDHTFHACLDGMLEQARDPERLERIWSPVLGAWFKGGLDDPKATLLRLTLREAAIWASSDSTLVFAYEIGRANLSEDHEPDLGDHVVVRFNRAA